MAQMTCCFIVCVLACIALCSGAAPETFQVTFNTTQGILVIDVTRAWSPLGVDRFYELVTSKYYDDNAFFRVIGGFVAQFGINGDPAISGKWANNEIANDPVVKSNTRGYVSFAAMGNGSGGTCCRTTQLYINYVDNSRLDAMGFSPIGVVSSGMEYADKFYSGYGESPDQGQIYSTGNSYLQKTFPLLDYLKTAVVSK